MDCEPTKALPPREAGPVYVRRSFVAQPIVPWIGGKRRLVDTLMARLPPHSCYVELFAGGAALFFLRHPADVEVLNDVNGDVINL
jgi:DNA adenine methylase